MIQYFNITLLLWIWDRKSFTLLFPSQYPLTYRTANTNRCKELVYITRCWIFGYKTVQWKFIEHSDLVRFGIKHKLIRDLLFSNYRKSHLEKWLKTPSMLRNQKDLFFLKILHSMPWERYFLMEYMISRDTRLNRIMLL